MLSSVILKRNAALLQRHPFIVQFVSMFVGAYRNAGNQASLSELFVTRDTLTNSNCIKVSQRGMYDGFCTAAAAIASQRRYH